MALDLFGKSVLIVEDEKVTRTIVAHLLANMGQPKVYEVENGTEALDYLSPVSGGVDFVISDFNMPVMHGLGLLKAIRTGERDIRRSTPLAMLTSHSDKDLVDLALALDVNAFLIKPVTKDGLELRLAKMLENVRSDLWLKANSIYSEIDVQSALDDVVGVSETEENSGSSETDDAQRESERLTGETFHSRRLYFKRKKQPLLNDPKLAPPGLTAGSQAENEEWARLLEEEATKSQRIVEVPATFKPVRDRQVSLDELPEGAILSRDIHTADGRLFMHGGALITDRVISILIDLADLGHPVADIWIAE